MLEGRIWQVGGKAVDWARVAALEKKVKVTDDGVMLKCFDIAVDDTYRAVGLALLSALDVQAHGFAYLPSATLIMDWVTSHRGQREVNGELYFYIPHEMIFKGELPVSMAPTITGA